MDALTLLRDQAALVNSLIPQMIKNVTPELASWRMEGSVANPIGAIMLHMYEVEDRTVQAAQDRPSIFVSGGWAERIGVDLDSLWTATVAPDLSALAAYAAEVTAASDAYLCSLAPGAMDEEISTAQGSRPRAARLSLLVVLHKMNHLGDISALLGAQGVKGFPF